MGKEKNVNNIEPGMDAAESVEEAETGAKRILIRIPARHNPRLQQIIDRINGDDELYALWQVMNVNAVQRLGMSDHALSISKLSLTLPSSFSGCLSSITSSPALPRITIFPLKTLR